MATNMYRFMYIKNHGVAQDLVDDIFDVSRRYHALPLEDKMADYVFKSETLRGYDIHYTNTPNGIVRKYYTSVPPSVQDLTDLLLK